MNKFNSNEKQIDFRLGYQTLRKNRHTPAQSAIGAIALQCRSDRGDRGDRATLPERSRCNGPAPPIAVFFRQPTGLFGRWLKQHPQHRLSSQLQHRAGADVVGELQLPGSFDCLNAALDIHQPMEASGFHE